MALFGKDERAGQVDEPRLAVSSTPMAESRHVGEVTDVQAHLGVGSRVEGKLHFDGSVRIDGHVEGEIEAQDTVIIGDSATVVARVSAATIVIKGKVTGDVTAHKRIELRAPARLLGNIVSPCLVIQEGVVFEGHCSMAGADERADKSPTKDKKVALFPTEDRSGMRAVSESAQ